MQKNSYTDATLSNEYTNGDPGNGIPRSKVGADWMNTIQRELVGLLARVGIVTDAADDGQLGQAMQLHVATIAALRLMPVPSVSAGRSVFVTVRGYATDGDGGGGAFYWDSASTVADDGGVTIRPSTNPTSGRWVRHVKKAQRVNAKWFGVKGDGVTDDTAAIALAVAYLATVGGGIIYFPDGTYLVTPTNLASVEAPVLAYAGTTILGAGPRRTIFKLNPITLTTSSTFLGFISVMGSNVRFQDFSIDGSKPADANWAASTSYKYGDSVLNDSGKTYRCIVGGISAGSGGPTGTSADITDNTVHWQYQSVVFNTAGVTTTGADLVRNGQNGGLDNITVKNVWAHDVTGINSESFVFTWHRPSGSVLTGNVTNLRYIDCKGWNVNGTPFHINGTIDPTSGGATWDSGSNSFLLDGGLMDRCQVWNCGWQGVSVYGCKNVTVQNSRFYNNGVQSQGGHGLNTEWSKDVVFQNNVSTGNTRRGASVYGRTGNIVFKGNKLVGNNTRNGNLDAEISIASGAWWQGTPLPKGLAGTVEIRNNIVLPIAGQPHLRVQHDSSGLTIGGPSPDSIILDQSDISSWNFQNVGSSSPQQYIGFSHVGGCPATPVGTRRLIDWTPSAGITVAVYAGAGNNSPGAVTIASNTQFANLLSQGILRPGHTYRVRARIQAEDTNAEWIAVIRENDGGTNQFTAFDFLPVSTPVNQVGTWYTTDFFFTVNPAWQTCRIQWMRNTAAGTSSSLDIDYCNVEELTQSSVAQSEASQWMGRVVGRGLAAPTTGSYHVGDLWLNDAPTTLGNLLWACTAAGTPGTWKQLGDAPFFTTQVSLGGAAGSNRDYIFTTTTGSFLGGANDNQPRFIVRVTNDAETGSNGGSNFQLISRNDDGSFLYTQILINRSNGVVQIGRTLSLKSNVLAYGTTVNVDAGSGNIQFLTPTNGTGYTVANPTNPVDGARLRLWTINTFGTLGTVTWGGAFKLQTTWVQPSASGQRRWIEFEYNSANSTWYETARGVGDVPN